MRTLRKQRLEDVYEKISEDIYKESTTSIKMHKVSKKIQIQQPVRQGDISSKLFTAVLEVFLRTCCGKRQKFRLM